MEIIDGHVNITESGKWGNTSHDASIDRLLKEMDEAGIEKSALMPLRPFTSNAWIGKIIKKHSDRLIGFGTITLNSFDEDIDYILQIGLKGVKFHPRIQNISLTKLDKSGALNLLENNNLPLTICGWLQSKSVPIEDLTPLHIDKIAKKYPKLKIIIAHMGAQHYWDAFFVVRANQNVYMNCSYFIEFFKGTSLELDFFSSLSKIDQKLIYGSDFPEVSLVDYFFYFKEKLQNINCDKEAIFANNFKHLL